MGFEGNKTFEEAVYREIEEETGVITTSLIKWVWERDIYLNSKKGPMLSMKDFILYD